MSSRRKPNPVTVKLSRYEADTLYAVASRAEDDSRWEHGRERLALARALDKFAMARANAAALDE